MTELLTFFYKIKVTASFQNKKEKKKKDLEKDLEKENLKFPRMEAFHYKATGNIFKQERQKTKNIIKNL